jgi:hypothetical protein
VGEGLAYFAESYNRIAHATSPFRGDINFAAFEGAGYAPRWVATFTQAFCSKRLCMGA